MQNFCLYPKSILDISQKLITLSFGQGPIVQKKKSGIKHLTLGYMTFNWNEYHLKGNSLKYLVEILHELFVFHMMVQMISDSNFS